MFDDRHPAINPLRVCSARPVAGGGPLERHRRTSLIAPAQPGFNLGMLLALLPAPMAALSLMLSLPKLGGLDLWPWWLAIAPLLLPSALGAAAVVPLVRQLMKSPERQG